MKLGVQGQGGEILDVARHEGSGGLEIEQFSWTSSLICVTSLIYKFQNIAIKNKVVIYLVQ